MKTKKEFKEIRARLLMKDITMAQIAKKFYISRQYVHQILRGMGKSDTAEEVRAYVTKILQD